METKTPDTPVRANLSAKIAPLGPWALVTGASDGIGAATAAELAAKGFNVILAARRKARLDALAGTLEERHGVVAHVVPVNLGAPDGVPALLAEIEHAGVALEDIGVAVLAAGYGTTGPLADVDVAIERDMLRVNCDAVLQLCHAFSKSMTARGAGHLVLFGSIVGFQGNALTAHYAATKAYVQTLAEGLGVEMSPHGVTVQAVAPGPIATGFAARAGMTMGQAGTPEVVAKAILRNLGKGGTIRPGLLSKLLGYNMALAPRPLRVRIMSKVMSGMAAPRSDATAAGQEA